MGDDITPAMRPYQPFGGASEAMTARDPEVLLSGPAGTGKTIAALTKLYLCAHKYPGMRGLIVRKTRESLSEAALVTFEQKVVPEGHPVLSGPQRRIRQVYEFPNGSEVVVGGLDKAQKVMSTEFDVIYVQEAIEVTEDDWESLTTRLRNNRMPYQQLVADTNPSHPRHWLKQRCNRGQTRLVETRHEDNPTLFDPVTRQVTPDGAKYLAKLNALTGARLHRLRYGRWVQAEGVVYEGFDPLVHVVEPRPIPPDWPRYWSIDFGFTLKHPLVILWWAVDGQGVAHCYREFRRVGVLVEHAAREAMRVSEGEPRPRAIVADHDAEDRATFEHHSGLRVTPADKGVTAGIQDVAERLVVLADGRPRIVFHRNALCHPADEAIVEAKRPTTVVEEFDAYVWNDKVTKEAPVKDQDDAMDCTRYLCRYLTAGRSVDHGNPYGELSASTDATRGGVFRGGNSPWWAFDGPDRPGVFRGGSGDGVWRG